MESLENLGFDGWGTPFFYDNTPFLDPDFGTNALGKLASFGGNGLLGGNDDITLHFFNGTIVSRVQGFVRDESNVPVPGVGITVNYPQNGVLTSQTVQTDSLGYYFFTGVPYGNRSLTVEPRLVLAPDTAIITANNNDTVELLVKNFASSDTSITSLTIAFGATPKVRPKIGKLKTAAK